MIKYVRSRILEVLFLFESRTQVAMWIRFVHDPTTIDFIDRVTFNSPEGDEFGILVMMSRIDDRSRFVLSSHGKQLRVILDLSSNIDFEL